MKLLATICALLAAGCSRCPEVAYHIPVQHQEAAAKLTAQLTESLSKHSWSGHSPSHIASAVRQQVLAVYGEPVTVNPSKP